MMCVCVCMMRYIKAVGGAGGHLKGVIKDVQGTYDSMQRVCRIVAQWTYHPGVGMHVPADTIVWPSVRWVIVLCRGLSWYKNWLLLF